MSNNVENEIVVAALYKFATLDNFKELQKPLLNFCKDNGIKGTLLLALEGINGTVAGSRCSIDSLLKYLKSDERLKKLDHKESFCTKMPFIRMKVKLKKEIVTIGDKNVDPNKIVGTYVEPKDWNDIISDPEVVVLDTRNDYEVDIGTFENAIDPKTKTFREFPKYVKENLDPKKHKKIAMFCTGGIRCEKASSYMLAEGFEEVYHLNGGILKYLETVDADKSMWNGECFVFDERVAVKGNLEVGSYDQCFGCRHPISEADKLSKNYEKGVSCPHCIDTLTPAKEHRFKERQKQIELAKKRNSPHIGQEIKHNIKSPEVHE